MGSKSATVWIRCAHPALRSPRTDPTGLPVPSRSRTDRATLSRAMPVPRGNTTASVAAVTPRTNHSVVACTGMSTSTTQRAGWASLLLQWADEAGLPADPEFRSAFVSYLEWGSRIALENSQTNARPPEHMPMPRWDWGTAGPPGSRISALTPRTEQEEEVALPAADEPVRFAQHIKPLFRPMDRQSMKWAFDLWVYKDVREHADGILQRLQNGSMPCDGPWSHEKVETFQRWVESGKQE